MSLSLPFYNGILRRYVIAFGTMFDGIYITREDDTGRSIQTIQVPLSYAPKDKVLNRLDQNPNLDKQVAIQLPRMSFEMVDVLYDATRKGQTTNQITSYSSDANKAKTIYAPVPYNLKFQLNIFVRNAEDGLKIVEQILPFFRPHRNMDVLLVPSMGIVHDVAVTFENISINDNYEGDYVSRRALIWTLDFNVAANLFGPIDNNKSVIKRVFGNLSLPTDDPNRVVQGVVVTPGLLANGSPTTNSAASIPRGQISANSNYGIAADIKIFI